MLYRQLPARSPIPGAAFPSVLAAWVNARDPRRDLQTLLENQFNADAMLCASGTHALQVALAAVKQTDERRLVLLPAYTCYEVATAAIGAGVRVALYDLNPDTLEPNWDSLRSAARDGAAAIVIAPLFGLPFDWTLARSISTDLDAILIEDAAQSHGSTWQQRAAGSLGDISILSFGRGKGWTGGGGGALLWRGEVARDVMARSNITLQTTDPRREAASSLKLAAQWLLARPRIYALPAALPFLGLGETIYHEPTTPRAMSRTAAALLLASKTAADAEVAHRRTNAQAYAAALSTAGGAVTAVIGARLNNDAGALRFPIRRHGGWHRLRLTSASLLGAAPGYPTTLLELPALRPFVTNARAFPGAERLAGELVTLPTHSAVRPQERSKLIRIVTTQ